jgi:UPF0755 protein
LNQKKIISISIVITIIIGIVGIYFYQKIFQGNILKSGEIFINSNDDFNKLTDKVAPFVSNIDNFIWVAKLKKFSKIKPGRYVVKEKMSNNDLVNIFRGGRQTAVNLSFNNQDTLEKLSGRIAEQLEADSISLLTAFRDEQFLLKNNFDENSILGIFIPNSYEFYWNTTAEKFRDKMLLEYQKFWNQNRLQKAKKLNLSPQEIITLASIVQKETAQNLERPIVAGLYLNRLQNNWPLQADPTVIYSIRQLKGQDYAIKRVLKADLDINSPYNTYKNLGLPPSLIAMPDVSSIDAVLNAEKHDYFYMCASIDKIGFHEFAKTLAQHNRNAEKYQNWLNKQGINR